MIKPSVIITLMCLAGMEAYSYRYDELTASRTKMAQPRYARTGSRPQLTGGSGYRIDYALWDISPRRFMTIRINTFLRFLSS